MCYVYMCTNDGWMWMSMAEVTVAQGQGDISGFDGGI